MEERKIIQIIPCSNRLRALYNDEESTFDIPIVCFALVEYEDKFKNEKFRVVEPMAMMLDGGVDFFIEDVNFKKVYEIK